MRLIRRREEKGQIELEREVKGRKRGTSESLLQFHSKQKMMKKSSSCNLRTESCASCRSGGVNAVKRNKQKDPN